MSESKRQSIKILNPSMDLSENDVVIRGVISPDSIHLLKVGSYQREILSGSAVHDLKEASILGTLPDIDLGMRGENYRAQEGAIYLQDPTFIIDGLQRTNGAKLAIDSNKVPRLGVCVRLNTTEKSEKARFEKLNATQRKLSPNVLLRNYKDTHKSMKLLYSLSHDATFAMNGRISWQQTKKKTQLMTARSFVSLAIKINYRVGNHSGNGRYDKLASAMERIVDKSGQKNTRHNVKYFFDVVNSVWNIDAVHYKEGAVFMRISFLSALAMLFARHKCFWKDGKLSVNKPIRDKLRSFALSDPYIKDLTNTGESGAKIVYNLLIDHVNSGKRNRRLVADI